jgi:hypothetical protein
MKFILSRDKFRTIFEKNQDGGVLTDPGTLTCMISYNYSRFSWQQGWGDTTFSANHDTANTEGTHNIFD